MQIQNQLASDSASTNILKKPGHILTFIKHALETATPSVETVQESHRKTGLGLRMEDLHIVDGDQDGELDEGDSDDEENESGDTEGDDGMTPTAVNLLLSVLEGNLSSITRNVC